MKHLLPFAIFLSIASASQCPAECPTECALQATRENVGAMFPLLKLIEKNLDIIFCGCPQSVTRAKVVQKTFLGTLNSFAIISNESIQITSKSAPLEDVIASASPKAALQIPAECQTAGCSCDCAKLILREMRSLTKEASNRLSRRCLPGSGCADRLAFFAEFGPTISLLRTYLAASTDTCT